MFIGSPLKIILKYTYNHISLLLYAYVRKYKQCAQFIAKQFPFPNNQKVESFRCKTTNTSLFFQALIK